MSGIIRFTGHTSSLQMGKAFAFPIVTRFFTCDKVPGRYLRLDLLERREDDFGQGGHAGDARAGGVVDGVQDGRVRGVSGASPQPEAP